MMIEEDQELKFACKLCDKKYRCRKSLGGHMKSHVVVVAKSAESEEKTAIDDDGNKTSISHDPKLVEPEKGQSGYVLRKNPKRSSRAFDSRLHLSQDNVCKQCGEGFRSMKALCGHMASHSDKSKDDYYDPWIDQNRKFASDSNSTDSEETTEECELQTRSSKSKQLLLKKVCVNSTPLSLGGNDRSSVSEIDELIEKEELAMCLIMLSRDSENKGGVNSVVESCDNNSVVMAAKSSFIDMRIAKEEGFVHIPKQNDVPLIKKNEVNKLKNIVSDDEITRLEDSDSGYFLGECTKAESDASVDGLRMNDALSKYKKTFLSTNYDSSGVGKKSNKSHRTEFNNTLTKEYHYDENGMTSNFVGNELRKRKFDNPQKNSISNADDNTCNNSSEKRSKYECFNCKKMFKSFQALGGHRPCHKRMNAYYETRYGSDVNSLEDDSSDHITNKAKWVVSSCSRNPSASSQKKVKSKKNNKRFVCPICSRVFKNGQALGGHKRSHFLGGGGHEVNANHSPVKKRERSDLLDLNLPAPEADDDDDDDDGNGQFSCW